MKNWIALLALLSAQVANAAEVSHLNRPAAAEAGLPFSEAVRVNDTLYLSGEIGRKPFATEVVPGGIEAEAKQALSNIRELLVANGLGLENVVKCTVMLADIAEWPAFNQIYLEFFEAPYPARSAFAASGLALGASVEVECIAAYPDR
ncbi:MAG: Rid family detoxifying hydrolase [Halieaceae bacterium]|nr:Rid family detoxifying hydrolase [Halieaceae bacterium]